MALSPSGAASNERIPKDEVIVFITQIVPNLCDIVISHGFPSRFPDCYLALSVVEMQEPGPLGYTWWSCRGIPDSTWPLEIHRQFHLV